MLNPLGVPSRTTPVSCLRITLAGRRSGLERHPELRRACRGCSSWPRWYSTAPPGGGESPTPSRPLTATSSTGTTRSTATWRAIYSVLQLSRTGKTWLFDGHRREVFREPITVGQTYILKLATLCRRQDSRPLHRPLQTDHAAAARRQGAWRPYWRDGSVGPVRVWRVQRAAGDPDRVRRHSHA